MKIVDEFTGRVMEGRRWSEGLHQAIEAKEGVQIREENVTLATITLQNYFRLYEKLAGMTGTAKTEEKEFVEIYNLHVVEIPTNVAVARDDKNDFIFKTKDAKFEAVLEDIVERHEKGQPVLVGTIAVETSEYLSELLTRNGVPHNVLNAKEHERESEIIVDAGQPGAVTIATNMAGRGVDIKLGEGVVEAGGLYVLATERHEARRIDNQLRGRSGRQGDPGETRFYLSAQDDLVRLFAGDRIHGIMEQVQDPGRSAHGGVDPLAADRGRAEEGRGAELRRAQERPQVRRRHELAAHGHLRAAPPGARGRRPLRRDHRLDPRGVVQQNVVGFTETDVGEDWDLDGLVAQMQALYGTDITVAELREEVDNTRDALVEEFTEDALDAYREREESFTPELMREIERFVILQVVDTRWREHLESMDYLREGIHLRAMAQKDPLVEYRGEGHKMFEELGRAIREEVVLTLFHVEIAPEDGAGGGFGENGHAPDLKPQGPSGNLTYAHETSAGADLIAATGDGGGGTALATPPAPRQVVNDHSDVGRNDPCWCGSGKKFKRCHGA